MGNQRYWSFFKNTLPNKLYWMLFPINNLREAVDTAKRVLNKEKLDKQLTGQASKISPFMKMRDDTQSGQKMLMKPQDLEAVSSRCIICLYNKVRQRNHSSPRFNRKRKRS